MNKELLMALRKGEIQRGGEQGSQQSFLRGVSGLGEP